jgi:hypothetical protein
MILVFGVIIGPGSTFLYLRDRLGPTPPPPTDRIAEMVREMKNKLDLSEKQEKQIHALFDERFKAMGEMFKSIGEKQKQEWDLTVNGMKSILSEEQFSAWKKDMDERRQKWGRDSRGQGGPGRGGPEGRSDGRSGQDRGDGRRGGPRPSTDDRPPQGPPPGDAMPSQDRQGPMGPPPGVDKPMDPPAPADSATETPKPTSTDSPVQQPPIEPKPQ